MVSMARLTLVAGLLSGCSTSSSLVDAVAVSLAEDGPVAIVEGGPPPKDWRSNVTGTKCQRYTWDPVPTKDQAVALMLEEAAARGFNAVHSVKVGADVRSLAMNCWSAVSATGVAFVDSTRPSVTPRRLSAPKPQDPHRSRMQQG